MMLRFTLPGPLHDFAGSRGEVRVEGEAASVSEALGLLWKAAPAVHDRVMNEQGQVRPHVNIFVDGDNIRQMSGLSTPVSDGAEIIILPAVSGG